MVFNCCNGLKLYMNQERYMETSVDVWEQNIEDIGGMSSEPMWTEEHLLRYISLLFVNKATLASVYLLY